MDLNKSPGFDKPERQLMFGAIAGNLLPIGVCTVFGAVIHRLDTWCDTLLPISTLTHHLDLVKMIPYFLNGTSIMGNL